jgi:methyl-accepting chemotaxis protein
MPNPTNKVIAVSIRRKLQILCLVTVIGLGLVSFVTILGLNAIMDTEETAHRRESYIAELLEIKASALSTIMLDPTLQETKDVFVAAGKNIDERGGKAVSAIHRAEIRDELKKMLALWSHYNDESLKLISLAATDAKRANDKLVPLYNQEFKPFQAALERYVQARQEEAAQGVTQAKATSDKTFWQLTVLLAAFAAIILSMLLTVAMSLESGLRAILRPLPPLSQGDLTQRLPDDRKDELGEIAAGVNSFVQELQNIVQRTRSQSDRLAVAAIQLASAAANVLQTTTHQSDATSSVAASVEQFSISIDQVSDNATQAEQKASQSGSLSQTGGAEVRDAVDEIRRIEQVVSEAAQQMQALGQQARDISSIVNVIKDVADQTNLLALNAAIEAARAGEQGRGFAVVADEVRKLAERTSSSAQEITNMVMSIQQSTETASDVMQQGNELVAHSVRQIEQAGNSMQQINTSSGDVVNAISEISTALREQRMAGAEIAQNVERIAQMTESGRNSASEVSAAAQQLELVANDLQKEVSKFKV